MHLYVSNQKFLNEIILSSSSSSSSSSFPVRGWEMQTEKRQTWFLTPWEVMKTATLAGTVLQGYTSSWMSTRTYVVTKMRYRAMGRLNRNSAERKYGFWSQCCLYPTKRYYTSHLEALAQILNLQNVRICTGYSLRSFQAQNLNRGRLFVRCHSRATVSNRMEWWEPMNKVDVDEPRFKFWLHHSLMGANHLPQQALLCKWEMSPVIFL